jgi:cbb3-type cytochrome oxidase subunit 1
MVMGITEQFQFANVHAHINLLGWATLALSGVIYALFPGAGSNKLATAHFWLQNIGLPVFAIGLFLNDTTMGKAAIPIISVGAIVAILGIIVFATNVLLNVKPAARA